MIIGGICPVCKYSALEIDVVKSITYTVCSNCKTELVVIKKGDKYLIRERYDEKRILNKAVEKWGVDAQVMMAIEEFGELIQCLAKLRRNINSSSVEDLIEEIVDSEIMLEQLKIMFVEERKDLYESIKKKKLKRLSELIGDDEDE